MKIKYISLLLAALLLLGLTACGKADDPPEEDPEEKPVYYIPKMLSFTSSARSIYDTCATGDAIYLVESATNDEVLHLFRLSAQGGEAEELPDFQTALPLEEALAPMATLRSGTDGTVWIEEIQYSTVDYEMIFFLRQLDGDGNELARYEYPKLQDKLGLGYVRDLMVDCDGDVFVDADGGVALLDQEGDPKFVLKPDSDFSNCRLIRLGDGRLAVPCAVMVEPGIGDWSLRIVDKENQAWGEDIPLAEASASILPVYDGGADALFYYVKNNTLYAWREEGETQIINLLDTGIDPGSLAAVSALADGGLVLQSGYDPVTLYVLTPSDTPPKEKKVLTLATLGMLGELQSAVSEFNSTSEEYRVEVMDYSQYGNYDAAMTRLVTEVGAGNMPDLIDLNGLPAARWGAGGLLEDLWPYIDSDSELGRDALMERVLQAAEIGGKLYEVSPTFWISTYTGRKDVVGDRMSWTGEDMWQAMEVMPEGSLPVAYGQLSTLTGMIDWSRFVDWETGTCSFDGGEFKALLEFCASLPAQSAWEATGKYGDQLFYEGQIMLMNDQVSSLYSPQRSKFILGGEISYVGAPTPWGGVGSRFQLLCNVGMSSACQNKEGAWAFLRTLLLPRSEAELLELSMFTSNGLPVNKADFQKMTEVCMTPEYELDFNGEVLLDRSGEKVQRPRNFSETLEWTDEPLQFYAVTQEEYDQIMALYNAVDSYSRWDPDLEPIVNELAGAYFAGDKSLEETVELIQRRATLYVGEHT